MAPTTPASRSRAARFARGFVPPAPDTPPPPLECSIEELIEAVERVLAMMPDPIIHRVVPRPLDVEGATARILELLGEREAFSWRDLLGPAPSVVDVLSSLVALLELARRGLLSLKQPRPFTAVVIDRGPAYATA